MALSSLARAARTIARPRNYFSGRRYGEACLVNNILFFARTTRRELQEATFELRPHHRFVVVFNLETSGVIRVDGTLHRVDPGEGLIILPFQFHTFPETADERILWLILTFEADHPSRLEFFRGKRFRFQPELPDEIAALVTLYRSSRDDGSNLLLGLGVSRLLVRLRSMVRAPVAPRARSEDSRSRQLLMDIEVRLRAAAGALSIGKLAAEINISDSRLRTRFRSAFGVSLGSYLRNYRLHRVIELMQDSRLNLTEIAHELGFGDSAALTRFFQTQTGMIPSKYRRRIFRPSLPKPSRRP